MISKKQTNFTSKNGNTLYGFIWSDENEKPDKAIVLCHGMAEHIDRYNDFAHSLVENGFVVFGYNQKGHKYTSPKEDYGYLGPGNSFEILVNDLDAVLAYVKTNYHLPTYLFGHSMGSFVSTRFSQLYGYKIAGLILSGTGKNSNLLLGVGYLLASIISLFRGKRYRSKLIDSMAFGSFNKKIEDHKTESDWLNTMDSEVAKYIDDEYCGGIFSVSYFKGFFRGLIKISKNIKKIPTNLPILLISGQEDPVGNYGQGVTKLYNILKKTNHKHVTIELLTDLRHEILLEKSGENVRKTIIDWLKTI